MQEGELASFLLADQSCKDTHNCLTPMGIAPPFQRSSTIPFFQL